jgi:hypothetical protein
MFDFAQSAHEQWFTGDHSRSRWCRASSGHGGSHQSTACDWRARSIQNLSGWDSMLSILQMPGGVPVATVAINGAKNAGILAAQILAASEPCLASKSHRLQTIP